MQYFYSNSIDACKAGNNMRPMVRNEVSIPSFFTSGSLSHIW
ncbi:MAG: hypothetical protein PHI32_09830 [Dysgonamonadaceae bacterium]|nr:hypothetical protein [Dysgonamonadaceae bacterium]